MGSIVVVASIYMYLCIISANGLCPQFYMCHGQKLDCQLSQGYILDPRDGMDEHKACTLV